MKINYLIGTLFLSPLFAFADNSTEGFIFSPLPKNKNTVVRHYTNEQKLPDLKQMSQRTVDFPTQIVRVRGNVAGLKLSCEEVEDEINKVFSKKIYPNLFTYNTYVSCGYDQDSPEQYAVSFSIQSYFDPLTDKAIDYLKAYLQEYNGYNLFNATTLQIENAKGVIISMNLNAGLKSNPDKTPFTLYRQDRNNFYFKSNFDMRKELIADIYQRFYSNDPEIILPFLDKWIFSYAGTVYYSILKASNYLELQPERIFVMENEGDIFVSDLRYYFANQCMKRNPNKHCL
ncbi:TPA: Lpg0189 family type II secretion system effector [Legionella anisa]|uniref:Lpg0189 family type II secretion system effector n=1 Tax=Legionella anisa TaxID=28082 RepID=UPI00197CB913|nr:Lpg0189 family type II secretion system effector [Legionella anisa]MBN5936123.1 Lpg0189 family type II secretion system effector [Legionella anisa]